MSTTTDLTPFDILKAETALFVDPVKTLTVTDVESAKVATAARQTIKVMQKALDAKRDELVRPLNDRVKTVNAYAKEIEALLVNADTHIKTRLQIYELEQEKIRDAQRKEAEEKARKEREAAAEIERKRQAELEEKRQAELKKLQDAEDERKRNVEAERQAALKKIQDDEDQRKLKEEQDAREKAAAISAFGADDEEVESKIEISHSGGSTNPRAEQAAIDERKRVEDKAAADAKAADQAAADERKRVEDQQERERLVEAARVQRETEEREKAAAKELKAIGSKRLPGAKKFWVHEVTDAALVPRQFLSINETEIRVAIAAGAREIPGLRIYEDLQIARVGGPRLSAASKG